MVLGKNVSCFVNLLNFAKSHLLLLFSRAEEIDTKSAKNRRKKQNPSFVISCQISVKVLHIFVHKLKTKLSYRLSADSRATSIVFLIFAVKSTFFPKNAKIKCVMSKNLRRIVRKKLYSYRVKTAVTHLTLSRACIKDGVRLDVSLSQRMLFLSGS